MILVTALHCSLLIADSPPSGGLAMVSVVSNGVGLADGLASAILRR